MVALGQKMKTSAITQAIGLQRLYAARAFEPTWIEELPRLEESHLDEALQQVSAVK